MIKIKIIGDVEKVAEKLRTNRPLTLGQILTCGDEESLRKFAQENPTLVQLVDENAVKPRSNKMYQKTSKTKAK